MKKFIYLFIAVFLVTTVCWSADEDKAISGELSNLTMIRGDTAYMKIYSTLTSLDDVIVQNDLWIIDTMPEVRNIKIFMNSPGGVAYSGFSLADLLIRIQKTHDVEIYASGVVASAAVIVFASIEKRYAGQSTSFLVHESRFSPDSKQQYSMSASDLDQMKALFDFLTRTYLDILEKQAPGLTRDQWQEQMKAEKWFNATQALEWGLVKEIR